MTLFRITSFKFLYCSVAFGIGFLIGIGNTVNHLYKPISRLIRVRVLSLLFYQKYKNVDFIGIAAMTDAGITERITMSYLQSHSVEH